MARRVCGVSRLLSGSHLIPMTLMYPGTNRLMEFGFVVGGIQVLVTQANHPLF